MDGTAAGMLASRRIFDEAISRFDRAMGTAIGGVPIDDEDSGSAAVQSRPSSTVVSDRYDRYQLTTEGGAACTLQLQLLSSLAELRALVLPAAAAAAAAAAAVRAPAAVEAAEDSEPALPPDFRFEQPGGALESERHAGPSLAARSDGGRVASIQLAQGVTSVAQTLTQT